MAAMTQFVLDTTSKLLRRHLPYRCRWCRGCLGSCGCDCLDGDRGGGRRSGGLPSKLNALNAFLFPTALDPNSGPFVLLERVWPWVEVVDASAKWVVQSLLEEPEEVLVVVAGTWGDGLEGGDIVV